MSSFCYIFDVRQNEFCGIVFFSLFSIAIIKGHSKKWLSLLPLIVGFSTWTFLSEPKKIFLFRMTKISSAGSFFSSKHWSSFAVEAYWCRSFVLLMWIAVCVCVLGCVYLWLIILFRHRWIRVHHRCHHFLVIVCWLPRCDTLTHSLVQTTEKTHLYSELSENNLFVCVFDYSRAIM